MTALGILQRVALVPSVGYQPGYPVCHTGFWLGGTTNQLFLSDA
nr:MAG TPA: hypothetical protein [Caudoviricetes sp.]